MTLMTYQGSPILDIRQAHGVCALVTNKITIRLRAETLTRCQSRQAIDVPVTYWARKAGGRLDLLKTPASSRHCKVLSSGRAGLTALPASKMRSND